MGLNKKDEERINNLWAGPVSNPCSVHNKTNKQKKKEKKKKKKKKKEKKRKKKKKREKKKNGYFGLSKVFSQAEVRKSPHFQAHLLF
ncbi:hypothetical protein llap_21611 [Limosa lapponica baueri]|uniref:Uncharacterized protein n=1 Tax=Limosa lapponica baueri TaxID=1758121 RepID=A0A2I0T2R5_LIMLA|nr:hypothetical protein llap_21611 [Limosa lapponica baueri]